MRKEAFLLLAGVLAACADNKPASITVDPLPALITDTAPHALNAGATNRAGERLADVQIGYQVTPSGIAQVDKGGLVSCVGVGEATVRITAGETTSDVTVKCRPVESIRAPKKLATFLGEGEVRLPAVAVGPAQTEMPDVPLTLTGYDAKVIQVKDGEIVPVTIGSTSVEAAAGDKKATVAVDVWKKVRTEDVRIAHELQVPLEAGNYLLRVNTETPVKLSWKGGNCEARPEAKEHELRCQVTATATLVLSNPGKAPAAGTMDIYLVP